MPGFLSSLPSFTLLSTETYYAKNIHPQTGNDLAYRMPEFAAEQISSVLLQCTLLRIYTDSA
jgi:hypothetical protein